MSWEFWEEGKIMSGATPPEQQFHPMSVSQVLDRTFRLYRGHFLRFMAIACVVYVPAGLLQAVAVPFLNFSLQSGRAGPGLGVAAAVASLVTAFLMMLAQSLCTGALTRAVSETYLGRDITVKGAYTSVLPVFPTMILAGILVGLVVFVGFLLLIVPGVIFSLWFALVMPAIIVERSGPTEAMGRSKSLVGGNLGRVFLVSLVVGVIGWVAGGAAGLVSVGIASLMPENLFLLQQAIQQLLSLGARIAVAPIGAAAFILLYYDLRIRKEGFDLEMLADQMKRETEESRDHPPAP